MTESTPVIIDVYRALQNIDRHDLVNVLEDLGVKAYSYEMALQRIADDGYKSNRQDLIRIAQEALK